MKQRYASHLLPIGDVYAQIDIAKAARADLPDEAILAPDNELTAGGGGGGGHAGFFLVRHRGLCDQGAHPGHPWSSFPLFVIHSVSRSQHQQLIQLGRRGQTLESSERLERTRERRADGPTPHPGYHAPLKQGTQVKEGLGQALWGLERCWWVREPGGHLVPCSQAGQPSAPSRPPGISWWPPSSTCPWRPTPELAHRRATLATTRLHIRSTLHYLQSLPPPARTRMTQG